jgi:hypothetical protein
MTFVPEANLMRQPAVRPVPHQACTAIGPWS